MTKKLLFIVVLAFLLAAPSVAQEQIDVAVVLPDTTTYRWVNDDQRFFEEFLDESDVSYEIYNADGNAINQKVAVDFAIERGARIILMVNLDSTSGAEIIELAHSHDIVVIDYDRLTIEGDGADYYVSFDNEVVGQLQGEGLVSAIESAQDEGQIEGIPQVVMLNGSPTDNNATLFRNGAYQVIEPYFESGDWELLTEYAVPNWNYEDAILIAGLLQTSYPRIDAVLAANDGLAQSVIDSFELADGDSLVLTGQDATVSGIQNILAGYQSMTVYKSIRAEVEATVELTLAILENDQEKIDELIDGQTIDNGSSDIPAMLLTPVSVTIDNIEETVIADGFRTWEEICVGEFEQFCPEDWDSEVDNEDED